MKILFIANHLKGYDGYSRYAIALLARLQKEGHDVQAVVYEGSEEYRYLEHVLLKPPQTYIANPIAMYQGARKVSALISTWRPDCVHVTVEPFGHLIPFMTLYGARTILTLHGTFAYIPNLLPVGLKRFFAFAASARMFRQVTHIVTVSAYTRKRVLELYPALAARSDSIRVITNGVESSGAVVRDEDIEQRFLNPRVLHVGGVTERKGVKEALCGLARYKEKYGAELPIRVVGSAHEDTKYGMETKELVSKLGLRSIEFTGRVPFAELEKEYSQSAVFLLPNINRGKEFEGFGLVYLEANQYGVPVVGGKGSGAEDAIKDGVSGYLVDSEDPEQIADALNKLLSDKERYRAVAKTSKEWSDAHTWDKQFKSYVSLYEGT